ncbi:MAG TPA: carbon-nitrogen hydrolase family protein [Phenylobacterium sp.]|nr:carbon-nitrogen hydrolase family protein [Phenylobacterium sp.]
MSHKVVKVAAVQAAPAFLDLERGVEKTIALIEEAASAGAQLIAFPECWLPGYPFWAWLDAPAWGMQFVGRYFEASMTADGPQAQRIAAAAAANGIWVVLGYSERCAGSLYIAQLLIDDHGRIVHARRKLKATHVERTIFGEGDGSDLRVHATSLGRLGALCCWEHLNPLTKYAMYAQDEQIHVAAWPSFSLYQGRAYALGHELNNAVSQVYAAEGQCFVIAPTAVVTQEIIDMLCDTDMKRELLPLGGGYTVIYGPDGALLSERLSPTAEGLVYADIDLSMIPFAKAAADPAGHYSRPDVARLLFNPAPSARVERLDRGSTHRDHSAIFAAEAGAEMPAQAESDAKLVL